MTDDITEDFADEAMVAARDLAEYVQELDQALAAMAAGDLPPETVEEEIAEAYDIYRQAPAAAQRSLDYTRSTREPELRITPERGKEQLRKVYEHFPIGDVDDGLPREVGTEQKQTLEYAALGTVMDTFEDTVMEFLGIRYGIETMGYDKLAQFLSDHDVELPGEMERDEFYDSAEIID